MPYRLQATHLFLTYPQCDESPQRLLEFLRDRLDVKHFSIGRERHGDGGFHLHAYVHLGKRCNIRRADYLDFEGHHGDYQRARAPRTSIEYTQKDGDFITDIRDFRERIQETRSNRELLDAIFEEGRIHQYRFWRDYRDSSRPAEEAPQYGRHAWWDNADAIELHPPGRRPEALWIWGPPQTGKTTYVFARDPQAFLISTPKDFVSWDGQGTYLFDEFDYSLWRDNTSFLNNLITLPRCVLTPPYYGVKSLPWPRFVFFTSNDTPVSIWNPGFLDRLHVFKCE